MKINRRYLAYALGSLALTSAVLCAAPLEGTAPLPAKAEIRNLGDRYQLYVNHQPFYINGAGLEFGNVSKLAQHGGNSFRTWRTENGQSSCQQVLDSALTNSLFVTMGLDIARQRHGFDYNDKAAVDQQFEQVKAEVIKYKDHPALIIWAIGNELNLGADNPKVWDAVNDISKMIHQIDTNHLTMTPLSGISKGLIQDIKTRASDLDLIGIQSYADIVNLPRNIKAAGWEGPYLVTEWGATGHWEVSKTDWGIPIENDSTTKADFYQKRFETAIRTDQKQCLGSYVFLWGQKQERTPTWYGMFLESGEETATVDTLHYLWNGHWPTNRSPRLEGVWLDGKTATQSVHLTCSQSYTAKVSATDPDNDLLNFSWVVLEEATDLKWGGDFETTPKPVTNVIANPALPEITVQAPSKPGAYRLFTYVRDGKGHAAHANIPFFVDSKTNTVEKTSL